MLSISSIQFLFLAHIIKTRWTLVVVSFHHLVVKSKTL